MELFKIDNTEAVKTSKFDEGIEALLEAFEADGTNVLPFKEGEESACQASATRMNKVYANALIELKVKVRQLKVNKNVHKGMYDKGYRMMIVLADAGEEVAPTTNPFGI